MFPTLVALHKRQAYSLPPPALAERRHGRLLRPGAAVRPKDERPHPRRAAGFLLFKRIAVVGSRIIVPTDLLPESAPLGPSQRRYCRPVGFEVDPMGVGGVSSAP